MKKKRFTKEQIVRILAEFESSKTAAEVYRHYQISDATLYRWRQQYKGVEKAELKRLRELEAENNRLKKIVAQQALDIDALKELLGKKW